MIRPWIALALAGCGGGSAPPSHGIDSGADGRFEILFQSGFEEADPFAPGSWESFEQTPPGQPAASVDVVEDPVHEGGRSLRATAPPGASGMSCGKASAGRSDLDVQLGDEVRYSAWLRLDAPLDQAAPQLLDIECLECSGGGPGVRVVTTRTGHIKVDWKFLNWYENNGQSPPADAPPDPPEGSFTIEPGAWFRLTLHMVLGKGADGITEILVNDTLDTSVVGTNIAPDGMDFLDHYPQIQLGLTCLPASNQAPATAYVDDVVVERAR